MKYKVRVSLKEDNIGAWFDHYYLTEKHPCQLNMMPIFIEIEDCQHIRENNAGKNFGKKYKYMYFNINDVSKYSVEECEDC